jgi:hypothetical protein
LLGRFEKEALPMIVKGEMKVSVHDVYDWEKVAEAHKEMEANKNSGKVSSGCLLWWCWLLILGSQIVLEIK